MEVTQTDIDQLKEELIGMKEKLGEVYYALIGNKLAGDGGLVKRVLDSESELEKLSMRVDLIERKAIRSDLYVRWLWAAGGFILAAVATIIIKSIFNQ